ncbi:cytochrome c maturation protein CcmE [Sorangium sp. So ce1078]|uniref:cytochrome c maturation protein CcmE n=1 Tax=Sorangium sp. So ce1078 TaxID=3133329 RepID=UPI003F61F074
MSKKLDEELAQALSLVEQQDTPAVVKPAAASPAKPRPSRSLGLLATLLVMVGALVALFLVGFKEAAVYATPVDQLLASKEKLAGRKVRVEGELVPGTLAKRDTPCEYRFQIHGTQAALPVRYAQCVIPDTFRDVPSGGVQVTVEGTLQQDGNFEASLVMAKCTSKYDPNSHEMKGGAAAGEGPLSLK